jgi:glycosyltransferase involved in cell wall biosynthesis
MTQKKPLISIIMPCYNAANFLKAAIQSILSQTYSRWELIIIDDASTDSTSKILKLYSRFSKIKVFKNRQNLGVAGSLNRALKLAKGKYIARMDADDLSHPTRLQKQLDFFQSHSGLIACGVQTEIINGQNQTTGTRSFPTGSQACHDYLMLTSPILHPTLMAKASIYKKIGYQTKYKTAEDWDLYFKLIKFGQLGNLPDTLYSYRQLFGSNGFKNIKKAFILITKIRLEAIKNGYQPAWLMLLSNLFQATVVFLLPERLVFRLFSFWRTNKNTTTSISAVQPA